MVTDFSDEKLLTAYRHITGLSKLITSEMDRRGLNIKHGEFSSREKAQQKKTIDNR